MTEISSLTPEPVPPGGREKTEAEEAPRRDRGSGLSANDGTSSLAAAARKTWDAGDRPADWQGHVYGLVVHTTGSGLPADADAHGVYHTVEAVNHYSVSHGCHYVIGWAGAHGGDLLQVANEREQAPGVGVTNDKEPDKDQRRSIDAGDFERDLPAVLVRLWRARWPHYADSLSLLPGTRTANSCYVHAECVPCVYHTDRGLVVGVGATPMRPGLRFTQAQHDTVAALALDVARRNGWPQGEQWWRSPRLLGHEDLTPISRHDAGGGWDPGYLREDPYFDWDYVYARIQLLQHDHRADTTGGDLRPSILDTLSALGAGFTELIRAGQERLAVAAAQRTGVTDVNEITNLVFFGRHPELEGRQIRNDETELAQEWIDIRDTIVRPAMDGPTVR